MTEERATYTADRPGRQYVRSETCKRGHDNWGTKTTKDGQKRYCKDCQKLWTQASMARKAAQPPEPDLSTARLHDMPDHLILGLAKAILNHAITNKWVAISPTVVLQKLQRGGADVNHAQIIDAMLLLEELHLIRHPDKHGHPWPIHATLRSPAFQPEPGTPLMAYLARTLTG